MYRQCEVHVAIGVEYYIHVPQVTQGSCVPQQQFSASMAVEHPKFAKVFDRYRPPELLLRDAGRRLHLWDVDLVFNADRLMYLAPMVVAI